MAFQKKTQFSAFLIRHSGDYILKSDYVDGFVDALKDRIPRYARSWNADYSAWVVASGFYNAVTNLLYEWFDFVFLPEMEKQKQGDRDFDVLCLLPSAPRELIDGAYRVLAKKLHPDRAGGSTEAMQKLNQAYENLKIRKSE